jgi:GTP:adenosylcobinamide-phosphate guanylyltransferase
MKEVLFIGAGTRGAKLVANELQPYLDFHGKTCIEHVVEAAMKARSIGDIYTWGDEKTLNRILQEHINQYQQKIVVIEERSNIVESFLFTYFNYVSSHNNTLRSLVNSWQQRKDINWTLLKRYLKTTDHWEEKINIIVSDIPLISSSELDFLIENKNRNADLLVGRTYKKDFDAILNGLEEPLDYNRAIKNFYTYRINNRDKDLIVNSFISGNPFRLNENIWNLIGNFYEDRTIIAGHKHNFGKITGNLLNFKRFFFPKFSERGQYTYTERLRAALYLAHSYQTIIKGRKNRILYRDLDLMYEKIRTLINRSVEYDLSHCFGAAFDIDTEYEADFVRRNFYTLKNLCYEHHKKIISR